MDTTPAPDNGGTHTPHPAHVGPYKILERLGEGGMGTVYLAEQSTPVQRRVALKLIKLGMDSRAIVTRFEQERQALAMMQHDGIARVYDCGTSDRGQPFFVMELVKGEPLTDYCEQHKLDLADRLQLMRQVCSAVQHAHQKGVVHRDLKPGNVLVSDEGGRRQIKIIDFGLAKAMGQKLSEASLFTEVGQVIGTLEYMAPEQADLHAVDIDTRADIYSLGVMLHELLVGCLPFSGEELRKKGFAEMQRMLREVDPPKPSSSLARSGSMAAIAGARRMSIGALKKALRNDLDWVVLKALEKDRNRRYETADAMALDLQRFLDHEPLAAGPPSASYRLKKLVRRHRGQVAAAAAVLLALVGGFIGTYAQYRRAEHEKLAEQQSAVRAQQNERLAQEKAAEALREKDRADLKADEALREKDRADLKAFEAERISEQLTENVREMRPLALRVYYDRAVTSEKDLHPPWPAKSAAMEKWLVEAGLLVIMRGELERAVAEFELNALPANAAQLEADRRSHPDWAEYEALERRVASMRRAESIRRGEVHLEVPPADASFLAAASRAGPTAGPDPWQVLASRADDLISTGGQETLALAVARAALEKAGSPDARRSSLVVLARAMLANGHDAQALDCIAEALLEAPAEDRPELQGIDRELRLAIDESAARLAAAEQQLATLSARVNRQRTFRFDNDLRQFLHDTTVDLLQQLDTIANERMVSVSRRLAWARRIEELTLHHPNARVDWAEARAAIGKADGVVASRSYRGAGIELRDENVTGLVPIGMNPVTKLWEFYELRSAWDGEADPAGLSIPVHAADGSILVDGATGIVFVLLPGGTFSMGAQDWDANLANFARDANHRDWPIEVRLGPFFLARHELTQAQWARLSEHAEQRGPALHRGAALPVEQVDWLQCSGLLAEHALLLPTEAQWEYACRAGTTTPWFCPETELPSYAMLDYRAGSAAGVPMQPLPVGSLVANAFGLHDMHGNVAEWCRDSFGSYTYIPHLDDEALQLLNDAGALAVASDEDALAVSTGDDHLVRGGDFIGSAARAAAHVRQSANRQSRSQAIGLRPARRLRP